MKICGKTTDNCLVAALLYCEKYPESGTSPHQ